VKAFETAVKLYKNKHDLDGQK